MDAYIPSARHYIDKKDVDAVVRALKSNSLSLGQQTQQFEEKFAQYLGVKHTVAVSSGTAGLHMAIRVLELKKGDEVITSPFSFIASANCLLYERVKPIFVDIDRKTLNINPNLIEKSITKKTKAILAIDIFGTPSDADEVNKIAEKYNLKVIGDCCEALGSTYKGKMVGSLYDASVFGFFPNKQITSGEGGIIATNSDKLNEIFRSLRSQGRPVNGEWGFHERLGYNYRMTEMEAALGLSQLNKFSWLVKKRQTIIDTYKKYLSQIKGIELLETPNKCFASRFTYIVRIKKNKRNQVMVDLDKNSIGYKKYFYPLHLQPYIKKEFGYKKGMFPICEKVSDETLSLPFFIGLSKNEIKYICKVIEESI